MNSDFWSQTRQRLENPSYKSKYVSNLFSQQGLQPETCKHDFDRPIKINQRPNHFIRRSHSQFHGASLPMNPEKTIPNQQKLMSSGLSRMGSLGSSSLPRLQRMNSDKQVYDKQRSERERDIISQEPRLYKDVIKAFPKFRLQSLDQEYWRRKSFIEGQPSKAYNHYSNFNALASIRADNLSKLSRQDN